MSFEKKYRLKPSTLPWPLWFLFYGIPILIVGGCGLVCLLTHWDWAERRFRKLMIELYREGGTAPDWH